MTVITKPLSEKKCHKNQEPLVESFNVGILEGGWSRGREGDAPSGSGGHTSSAMTACLFLTALLVMSCGIITGVCLYKQFARTQFQRFHSWCSVPYEEASGLQGMPMDHKMDNQDFALFEKVAIKGNYFNEEVEIDEGYEKITVPDFSGGKRSRFIHDFKVNKTGIIDMDGHRCFVMPLNRTLVLPPKSLRDLVSKMREGYYDVDTGVLRDTMRVVLPAMDNRSSLGPYIKRECFGYPIYQLEKVVSGVFKRSASPDAKFIEFAGKNTHELSIMNYDELEEHESQRPVAMA